HYGRFGIRSGPESSTLVFRRSARSRLPGWHAGDRTSSRQLLEQGLGLLQVECVDPFGKPVEDRTEKVASRIPLSLIAPQPCKIDRRAQLEGLRALITSRHESEVERGLG